MRAFTYILLILVLGVGGGAVMKLRGQDGPNAYADECSTTFDKITAIEFCTGGPDQQYVEMTKGDASNFLLLDMGEGQEGTSNLIIHYKTENQVTITVEFLALVEEETQSIAQKKVDLPAEHTKTMVPYTEPTKAYRYVRLYVSPERKYKLDAIQAETHGPDSDRDGLPDTFELTYQLDVLSGTGDDGPNGDPDMDWVTNKVEEEKKTNPRDSDTDDDGLPEDWEIKFDLEANNSKGNHGKTGDPDADGLPNHLEHEHETNPQKADSDKDGLTDGEEVNKYKTNPNEEDTDGDTLPDKWEVTYEFNPNVPDDPEADPDADGLTNLQESKEGTDPKKEDTDNDCTKDLDEINQGTNPKKWEDGDCDRDGLTNGDEQNKYKTLPANPDTDGDGLWDGWEVKHQFKPLETKGADGRKGDPDLDGTDNISEFLHGADPNHPDTDKDTLPDIWEIRFCLDPTNPKDEDGPDGNPDGDQYTNFVEMGMGTEPKVCSP
ncbi:MAG: hypothetical protein HUU38_29695 [Anaerolineales bacterium]|nr:hypothetical protein [Anaerolineales bacterium]